MKDHPVFMTIPEVCEYLGVSRHRVSEWLHRGLFEFKKVRGKNNNGTRYLIYTESVDEFVNSPHLVDFNYKKQIAKIAADARKAAGIEA